jgi:tetratricopeptide (TPR) repeat protein
MVRARRRFAALPDFTHAAALVGVLLVSACSVAEVLILRDGRKIAGDCRPTGKEVAVSRAMTTRYVPRALIERVELQPGEQREFDAMRMELERAGASGQCRLGKWLDDHLQYDEAEKFYLKAVELDPNHSEARRALGYRSDGKSWVADPAKRLARASLGFGSASADACVRLGKVYAEKGQTRTAENAFRRALVADPEHQEALTLIQPYLADYKPKNSCRKPLDGKTIAVSGHNHRFAAYMYHAIDLAKVDEQGQLFSGDERKLESYYTFGAPVVAAASGEVISVIDRYPDMPIGEPGDFLQANSVCIQHAGGEYTLYAHLKQGSAAVRKGQRVKAGALLGKVGNSGSSWSPHLHFCLYDSDGISLPVKFADSAPEPKR